MGGSKSICESEPEFYNFFATILTATVHCIRDHSISLRNMGVVMIDIR